MYKKRNTAATAWFIHHITRYVIAYTLGRLQKDTVFSYILFYIIHALQSQYMDSGFDL